MSPARQVAADPLDRAIDWMVLLESGQASEADRASFSAWVGDDPRHAQAWQTVSGAVAGTLAPVRGPQAGAASAALRQPVSRRKWMLGAGALLLAGGGAWVANRRTPLATLAADLRTDTAQRARYDLDDGSALTLNARSAADVDFNDSERRVWLRAGALLAEVAADARHAPPRPFVVATAHGEVHAGPAPGAAFAVERGDVGSLVTVLRRTVEVWSQGARVALGAGEALRLDAAGAGEAMAASAWRAAWHDGMLIVRDEPLENVIAALRDYRSGWIRLSPQAARLRVLGAFPLDDTDAALDALAQTLPIVVRRHGGWLVTIDARAA